MKVSTKGGLGHHHPRHHHHVYITTSYNFEYYIKPIVSTLGTTLQFVDILTNILIDILKF